MTLTVGSLFAGIGGIELGLERTGGFKTVWQVEKDDYARRVLAKHWPDVRRHDDVRTFPPDETWERPDLICGGFPCVNISSSGKKDGIKGEHSGLWFEFSRIIRQLRPSIVFVENVATIIHRGMGELLGCLADCGFDAEWQVLPAAAFGLPQRRPRMFVVAYSRCSRRERLKEWDCQGTFAKGRIDDDGLAMAEHRARDAKSWVCRADDGIPNRLDRVRCLGNAVVPQVAQWIGERILEAESKLTS